jgi:hypothetical protein
MDEILIIVFNADNIGKDLLLLAYSHIFFCGLGVWMFRTVHSVGWRFQRRRRLHLYTKLENRDGQQLPTVAAGPSQQQLQLEQSLRGLLQFQTNQKSPGGASSEQITELTQSVNKFLENMEAGQKNKSDKES